MSTQVVKCSICGMRFNGSEYAQCPYCQERKAGGGKGKEWPWHRRKPVRADLPAAGPSEEPGKPEPERSGPTAMDPSPTPCPEPAGPEAVPDQPASGGNGHTQSFWSSVPEEPKGKKEPPQPGPTIWEELPLPRPEEKPELKTKIQELGPTTAKYINTSGGGVTYPAVGWLVCVKGVYYGKSFPLRSGINTVGRSPDMDVPLLLDQSVSRKIAVRIGYDSRANAFHAWAGDSSEFCVISGNTLYERVPLAGFEEIEFGDTGASKYLFVPLCGDRFQWSDYPSQS